MGDPKGSLIIFYVTNSLINSHIPHTLSNRCNFAAQSDTNHSRLFKLQ